ncbi:MAG TPA: LysE family translocator [Xanthobacteraceae bacterium]|nr:LysE family translocator [Xanthobacteraceae bacterium]
MDGLPGFILAALALCGSPGPATVSLSATGAAFGPRRGVAYMSGIDAGMVVVMSLTAAGITGLVLAIPGAAPVVAVLAALYFVHLAWRIASAPPLQDTAQGSEPSFMAGVLLSLINPKGYAAMAALFSGFALVRGRPELDAALKLGVLVAIVASVNAAWLFAGAALTRFFREPRTSRIINVAFAILLVASVAAAFLL